MAAPSRRPISTPLPWAKAARSASAKARKLFSACARYVASPVHSERRSRFSAATAFPDGSYILSEQLLYAAGREGRADELGLAAVGIEHDARGYLKVDSLFRTSVPNVLAAGDAIGFPALAATSMEQGRVAVCHAFGLCPLLCHA